MIILDFKLTKLQALQFFNVPQKNNVFYCSFGLRISIPLSNFQPLNSTLRRGCFDFGIGDARGLFRIPLPT